MMRFKQLLGAALVLVLGAGEAGASPVTWTLGQTLAANGFTVSGTFDFDADTGLYTDGAFRFTVSRNTYGVNGGSNANTLNFGTSNGTGIFTLDFDTPLTDAGGTVQATLDSTSFGQHETVDASVDAPSPPSTVPEPTSAALVAFSLGAMGWVARKKAGKGPSGGQHAF